MSSKPTKMRKLLFTRPIHRMSSSLRASLFSDLKSKHAINSARIRKGDSVKIMRGEYKGVEGKVTEVFLNSGKITIEGVTREKIAGGTSPVQIHSSNVSITSLDLGDPLRKKRIQGN